MSSNSEFSNSSILFGSSDLSDNCEQDEVDEIINRNNESIVETSDTDLDEEENEIPRRRRKHGENPLWKHISGEGTALAPPQWLGERRLAEEVKRPIQYFREFFSVDIMDYIVEQSNLYSVQQNPNKNLQLKRDELEKFLGTCLAMSMVKLSSTRLYWQSNLHCPIVSEAISRDRWEQIKSNIHFNDNSKLDTRHEIEKLFKIRPIIEHMQKKFREIPMPQMVCIDEEIIPFKGKSIMKKYVPSKPHKWGYKIIALCDTTGIMYDFFINCDPIEQVPGEPDLGASSNAVLQLAAVIPPGVNHLLYFDNWFTSLPLMVHLAKRNIYCLGTVRINRLPGIPFSTDKELTKKGKGSHEEVSALIDGIQIRATKWTDNKVVTLLSSFTSAEPIDTIQRYDRQLKTQRSIPCPAIIKTYNKFMGGVDLMNSLIALYRIHIRSKKYYHKIFFHLLDVAVINSWLLYRRDCEDCQILKKNRMPLQEFKMSIAKALILEGKFAEQKRGRPSTSSTETLFTKKKTAGPATKHIPVPEIRKDGFHHYPTVTNRGRCKNPQCKSVPVFYCNKCKVHLCITKNKNCFLEFHTK